MQILTAWNAMESWKSRIDSRVDFARNNSIFIVSYCTIRNNAAQLKAFKLLRNTFNGPRSKCRLTLYPPYFILRTIEFRSAGTAVFVFPENNWFTAGGILSARSIADHANASCFIAIDNAKDKGWIAEIARWYVEQWVIDFYDYIQYIN